MAGDGRPPTTLEHATKESRGWPAFAGHDTEGACNVAKGQCLRRLVCAGQDCGPKALSPGAPSPPPVGIASPRVVAPRDFCARRFAQPRPQRRVAGKSLDGAPHRPARLRIEQYRPFRRRAGSLECSADPGRRSRGPPPCIRRSLAARHSSRPAAARRCRSRLPAPGRPRAAAGR